MPSADAWDYYPEDSHYTWADAYDSRDTSEYTYMLMSVDCPIHGTSHECPCIIDYRTTVYPGEAKPIER